MANEITVNISLGVRKNSDDGTIVLVNHNPQDTWRMDMAAKSGPFVGTLVAPTTGIDVPMTGINTPGLCRLKNQDQANYVEYGIKDSGTGKFYPLGELGPGETNIVKLSRYLGQYYTGTGTALASTDTLHLKASVASCDVLVEVFDR